MVTQLRSGVVVLWALWNCSRESRRQRSQSLVLNRACDVYYVHFSEHSQYKDKDTMIPVQGHSDHSTCLE